MNELINNYANKIIKRPNDEYPEFLAALKENFNSLTKKDNAKLFTTDAGGLYDKFLNNLPQEARQHYTCKACRHFVERFGGLVLIKENGDIEPAIWGKVPQFFTPSVNAIVEEIVHSRVTGVFISNNAVLGPLSAEIYISEEDTDDIENCSLIFPQ